MVALNLTRRSGPSTTGELHSTFNYRLRVISITPSSHVPVHLNVAQYECLDTTGFYIDTGGQLLIIGFASWQDSQPLPEREYDWHLRLFL